MFDVRVAVCGCVFVVCLMCVFDVCVCGCVCGCVFSFREEFGAHVGLHVNIFLCEFLRVGCVCVPRCVCVCVCMNTAYIAFPLGIMLHDSSGSGC